MEAFGQTVSDAQYDQLERMAPYARYFAAAGQIVGLPLTALVIAGIAFAIFTGSFGADATFRQVFSIVAFSGVVIAFITFVTLYLFATDFVLTIVARQLGLYSG